jgi:hypothetical protein
LALNVQCFHLPPLHDDARCSLHTRLRSPQHCVYA